MKKFLVLQMRPEDETANSEFEAILSKGEINQDQVDRIRVEQLKVKDVDLDKYCGIIAGGSPFDLTTPLKDRSEVQNEVVSFFYRLFDKVVPADFPFLGACSGNGLLGSYCGVNISTKYSEPIGPVDVFQTNEAKSDDLLKNLPESFSALVGHKEACDDVPEQAVLLLTSSPCPVQMFRIKSNIYATQFHPEADEKEFLLRIDTYKNYGYFPPEEAKDLMKKIQGVSAPHTNEILKRFVNKYRSA